VDRAYRLEQPGTAEGDLTRTNALRDAREAEDAGIRLQLP
jgi:hypothetical protein